MSDTSFIGKNAVSEDRLNCLLSNVWKEVTYDEYGHWKDRHFYGVPYTCKRVGDQLYKKYKVWAKDWEVAKFIKTFVVSHLVKYLNEYPADENSDWIFDCLIDEFIRDIESDLYPDGYNYGKIEKAMEKIQDVYEQKHKGIWKFDDPYDLRSTIHGVLYNIHEERKKHETSRYSPSHCTTSGFEALREKWRAEERERRYKRIKEAEERRRREEDEKARVKGSKKDREEESLARALMEELREATEEEEKKEIAKSLKIFQDCNADISRIETMHKIKEREKAKEKEEEALRWRKMLESPVDEMKCEGYDFHDVGEATNEARRRLLSSGSITSSIEEFMSIMRVVIKHMGAKAITLPNGEERKKVIYPLAMNALKAVMKKLLTDSFLYNLRDAAQLKADTRELI